MQAKKLFLSAALITGLSLGLNAKNLATVDGYNITTEMVNTLLKQVTQNPSADYNALQNQQKQILLKQLIDQIVVVNAAKKEGLDKTDMYKMGEMQILAQLWAQKQMESIKGTNVSDNEAMNFYNQNKDQFTQQTADASHILVRTKEEAQGIIDELNKAPKSKVKAKFAELAKKLSLDSSKENGGSISGVNVNEFVPEFKDALIKLAPNTYTKTPIKTQFGYHVIYLTKLGQKTTIPFDKVKSEIVRGLKTQKDQKILQDKVEELKSKAKINIKD